MTHNESGLTSILCVYYSLKGQFYEWLLPLEQIICVHRLKHATRPYTFTILCQRTDINEIKQEIVLDMGDEKTLKDWISILQPCPADGKDDTVNFLWAISELGQIFRCAVSCEAFSHMQSSDFRWLNIPGHLKRVVCNEDRVTWGFGFDGKAYTHHPHLQHNVENESIEEHVIYENQRWNPVEGYTSRFEIFSNENLLHNLLSHFLKSKQEIQL